MTENLNAEYAKAFDCGDGVPALSILAQEGQVQDDINMDEAAQADETGPLMTARVAAVMATVVGQLGIGATILLGANPVIGGFAALMMMICGLALALAEVADARK